VRSPARLASAVAPLWPPACEALGIARRLGGEGRHVALTFDDGPHPQGTPAVMEALASAGATATFFLVGEQVERWPALAAELVAAGHEVALHGHRHRTLLRVPARALAADLDRGAAVLEDATARAVAHYRPPYGIFTPAGLALARGRGWAPVLWSRWGKDWRRFTTPERIARRLTAEAGPGDVLLLHDADHYSARDSWRRTVAALPRVLDALAERALSPVNLGDAVTLERPAAGPRR
jgi:peptidoglycan/xylan/chitin deacetylase (PgdA/CDA1 family)